MPFKRLFLIFLGLTVFGCLGVQSAKADPLLFSNLVALQDNDSTRIDIFTQPGIKLYGPKINFLVDISGIIPPTPNQTLSVTFTEAGKSPVSQTFLLFPGLPSTFSFLFSVTALGATTTGVDASLTIDILGSDPDFFNPSTGQLQNSYTYNFKIAQPVPEPGSLVLMSLGLLTLCEGIRRRPLG